MTLIKSISGIRGTIGGKASEGLTPEDVLKYATAFGLWTKQRFSSQKKVKIVIGRDARISGSIISNIVSSALLAMGIDVVDLGLSTTPTVELAVTAENANSGLIITASHNPKQWNALKLLNEKGEFISAKDGEELLQLAENSTITYSDINDLGIYTYKNHYIQYHIEKILALPLVDVEAIKKAKFQIAVDAVNSTGGIAVPKLLRALGVEKVIEINCEPTGNFAHNPEPLPENLLETANYIKKDKVDLGIVVDPDVDRLAFITEEGEMFGEEYTLVAIADYVLKHKKGNTVSNLSSTRALKDITEKHQCNHFSSAVGEVNVVEMMKQQNAVIGGEGNGGIIYPELHYGRDALVGIALFLTHLAKFGKTCSLLRHTYPNYYIAKKKIELSTEIDVDAILIAIKDKYKKQPINDIDGIKIEFNTDWVHLRKSNTEPIIRIYAESQTENTANTLANKIISDIKEIIR